jgi:hypothetical protein
MQPQSPAVNSATLALVSDAIKVTVRSCRGDGTRLFVVEASASGKIEDLKQLLCRPPHSMRSDASTFVLVMKGKGGRASIAHASHRCHVIYSIQI